MQIQTQINPTHFINKASKEHLLHGQDTIKSDDVNNGTQIKPYIPVSVCDNLIYQTVLLQTCIDTLAEDMVLNDIGLTTKIESDNVKVELVKDFWLNNQDELLKQVTDYLSYGFGGAEIIFETDNDEPVELVQIQADTLYISKETVNDYTTGESRTVYYAVQQVNGVTKTKMRLLDKLDEYPESDNDLHICFWLGGGRKSSFYDYPTWISAFNHISASVSLDMLDADKLANGNLISGILIIKRPPLNPNLDDSVEDTLEEKMEEKGSGIFTLELTSLNPDIPLTVDYVQISESNYSYLSEMSSKADKKILACFKIPKARLLIDDTTESMNSNKTNTLYKIYSNELSKRQRPLENLIQKFNSILFETDTNVDIVTPVFVDDKEVEANINTALFDKGLITLGQAIQKILTIFPEYNDYLNIDIDFDNPIYNERYYNGNPLGLTEDLTNPVQELGDLIDYTKITELLQTEGNNRQSIPQKDSIQNPILQ